MVMFTCAAHNAAGEVLHSLQFYLFIIDGTQCELVRKGLLSWCKIHVVVVKC